MNWPIVTPKTRIVGDVLKNLLVAVLMLVAVGIAAYLKFIGYKEHSRILGLPRYPKPASSKR